ncbi:MAG: class I SAM-dependent methyltransferase [Nitrospiraceae bacterium]
MKNITRIAMRFLLMLDNVVSKLINRLAIPYDGGVHVKHRLMRYHDFFVNRIAPGERVLDIGCGYGAVAYSLATKAGALVTGVDLNEVNVAKARGRFHHPNLTFVHGDARTNLPPGPWDVLVLSNILEHIEQRASFLTELQQGLRPNRMLIRVPMIDRDWRVPLREELGMFHFGDATHFTEYTAESFEKEVTVAGLSIHHVQYNWGEIWAEVVPATFSDALGSRSS